LSDILQIKIDRIGGVMISVVTSSAGDRGFEPRSDQTKDYKISTYCFWREQVNVQWEDDEIRFVLDQHAQLDLYSASSPTQQSADRHVAPLGHVILSHGSCLSGLILSTDQSVIKRSRTKWCCPNGNTIGQYF
jgi:hypothetical protein